MKRFASAVAVLALAALSLTACGSDDDSGSSDTTTLNVYAAASLTATFTELAGDFEADHPGVKVALNFGGSSDLVTQIQGGAGADVFASADTTNMDKLGDDVDTPENFASNTLEIATPPDNPAGVKTLDDLANPQVKVVLCAPEVPCGSAAVKVEQAAGIDILPVSEEQSVTDVLAKVTSGEADAGLVYVTDVKAAGDAVLGLTFPESSSAVNVYPIAVVKDTKEEKLAGEFMDLVTGDTGQQVLAAAGFAPAP